MRSCATVKIVQRGGDATDRDLLTSDLEALHGSSLLPPSSRNITGLAHHDNGAARSVLIFLTLFDHLLAAVVVVGGGDILEGDRHGIAAASFVDELV